MNNGLFLVHHGIKGQKHGHRRWQYPDGSLTPEGYVHYGINPSRKPGLLKRYNRSYNYKQAKKQYKKVSSDAVSEAVSRKP